jgi:C4-dicarboxylate-specific signal transduction histidine kinase
MRLPPGAVAWLLWPVLAAAATPADDRAALAERRQAVERGFQAAQAACATRFAVSSCLEAARLKRRDELVALQKAEAALAARERREASGRRADRPAAVPASAPVAMPASGADAASALPRKPSPERAAASASANVGGLPPPRPVQPDRAADERRARAIHEQRQQEAEARRRKVEQRNAERPSKAAPLPVPASSAGR